MLDLATLSTALDAQDAVVRIVLAEVRGSTPREAGTEMLVWADGASGTIGGGRLEWEAMAAARDMLMSDGPAVQLYTFALGPELNQCCGGAVTAVLELWDNARYRALNCAFAGIYVRPIRAEPSDMPHPLRRKCAKWENHDAPMPITLQGGWLAEPVWCSLLPVFIYGAGHVGRALAQVLNPMPNFDVCVNDTRLHELAKLPNGIKSSHIKPAELMGTAGPNAAHLIMTPEHDHDLSLCHTVLQRSFAYAGLIGSATKWARFRSRLAALGHDQAAISRIICPIGDAKLGKHPQAIAVGVAAQLLTIKAPERVKGDKRE
jgi:xanthine dehydrogenase accessory factor